MKKIILLLAIVLTATAVAIGQAPGIFNYQGVARNSVGNVLINKTISLRLTIHDGAAAGPVVYQETRTATTNPFGLFNIQVGSPGASAVTGTVAGVPWNLGSKFIQVEIDPNGGTSFINIGTAQIASTPYALFATTAGDMVLPFIKTQAAPGTTLIGLTNSATTGTLGAFTGVSASTDGNAYAITGTISSASPGAFSAGLRGINNGTGGFGIGVYGSQAGGGWGVYGFTPSGRGVFGESTSGIGIFGSSSSGIGVYGTSSTGRAGLFENTNSANTSDALVATTNGAASSWAIRGTSTGLQGAGIFTYNNAAGAANALRVTNNGSGAGISVSATGTGSAGVFSNTNAANSASPVTITTNSTNAPALSVAGPDIWGSAIGITNSTSGMEWRMSVSGTTWGITKVPGSTFTPFQLFSDGQIEHPSSAGASRLRILDNGNVGLGINAPTRRLHVVGGVNITDGTQANNFVLRSDATGNANWVDPASLLPGANFWTRTGATLWNTNLGDNVGVGTNTPAYRLDVLHGGATGIHVRSTAAFSVVDIDAANGDAALRYQSAGTTRWNVRNAPGTNDYQIVRNNSLPANVTINNGTGFVGITQTAPSYQLDVLHTGSTGIRSQSSSSFSVVDIDAASGDAALRFQNAGVGQWNTRNRPGDDYYEIFELGGGGSRVVIQDGTGNVGIGETTNPSYKLDVLHGGSTGTRIRSSSSFSVVDIDAASGDAALRFQNAGVGQWNTRNRPGDDYYEIFELGGGGSRVVIQDGTGNVGIGETTNPTYKLDVLHGGATGIRSRSSGTFSVIDIDGANGDAALRFANAGVNQWNIRNRPADDYLEIFELGGGGSRMVIQDGSGNVGIGETTNPTYKLDVLHGGATGIRSRSSGTFSVIDIDGANGDAALRFARAGVNQWNVRNRPADDYFEIFELGGGGSRVVIQDGSGNVGIGQTTNPTYKLDVLHGGATGLRVQSSATFSIIDIDGANGDAALRFAKAGVNQWNTRNNPATDDYQIFELGGGGERMRIENTTGTVVVTGDFTVSGVKAFTMDHPLDPANKLLRHAAAESNEVINFYSGNITTDASGKAVVSLPDYYEALNKDSRYQLTVIGSFAQAIISKEVSNNKFEIATSVPNVKVSWEVKGVRNDARMKQHPFVAEEVKSAAQKGKYWDPAAHKQPATSGVSYDRNMESSLNDVKAEPLKKATPATTGGSLDQPKIVAPATKAIDNSGSVASTEASKIVVKPVDNSGSVAPSTEKKAEVKVVDDKSGSVAPTEVKKPVEEKKPVSTVPESTKTN